MTPRSTRSWLRFLAWRQWGVLYLNPVFENTFVFFYVFAMARVALTDVCLDLGAFLALILAMSSYGFLLNDAVDCERDLGHGDDNVFEGLSPLHSAGVVGLALLANLPLLTYFASTPWLVATWIAWFVLTTLYSLPGIYLKGRGLTGLITVMLAMRTLPTLMVLETFDPQPDLAWLLILLYVSLRGFTGDLAHQLHDFDEDTVDGIQTYGVARGYEHSASLLDITLHVERLALLLMTGWMMWTLADRSDLTQPTTTFHAVLVLVLAVLTGFAYRVKRQTPDHINPHQPVYPNKDVFYLLHKTFPKIVLSLYLALLLVPIDLTWGIPILLLAVYSRVFSPRRLRAALRLRPAGGGSHDA